MLQPYKFQEEGLTQILDNEEATGERSALVADDMGLGKTIEAIVLDLRRRRKHNCDYTARTLVVTQTSVMGAWKKEYNKWAPHLNVIEIDRKNRQSFIKALTALDGVGLPAHHVYVCHWQVLRFIAEELKVVDWFHIIGDEIHNIKNRKAQQTQTFKKLKAYYKTGLSGTWADNKPDDAWSVLNWLWPKVYTSYWGFFNHHVLFEEQFVKGRTIKKVTGFAGEEIIHKQMGMAYLRRTKEEVWEDLPEKTYDDILVDLHPKQRTAYDQMQHDMLAWVGRNEDQPIMAPSVISKLVRLQQFAVAHGRLDTMKRFAGIVDEQHIREHSQIGRCNHKLGERLYADQVQLVLDEPSSKLDAAMELIEATNEQVVVFGQSKQAINLLAARLQAANIPSGVLTGDTKQADRDHYIEEFQAGRRRVFCSTIKAGGVGITLTAGTICIFLDRAWSPSANRQAEDRLHRLGQKNAVFIITLVARGTIDAERNESIEMKWEWLKTILDPKRG